MPCKQHNKETPTTSLSSDDEKEDTFDEDDKDGGFSKFAPIGEAPMTRALSGYDPTSARTMTAQQAKDGRPRGKQWWKEKFPMFVERVEGPATQGNRRTSTVVICDQSTRDLGLKIKNGTSTETDVTTFFKQLQITGKEGEVQHDTKTKKNWKKFKEVTKAKFSLDREAGQGLGEGRKGVEYIDYRCYPMRDYTDMPEYLIKGLEMAKCDYILVIGRPTMAPGAGLRGYKEVTTKKERLLAPCIAVYDHPGMLEEFEDDGYSWIEMYIGDAFMLDVSEMKSKEDYKTVLTKKGKRNYTQKMKKFNQEKNVGYELVDWVGSEENIDRVWPLYAATGEKNGFTVLTKEDFYKYHRSVPNQKVAYIWDVTDGPEKKKLMSFCTAFVWKDILHPMWCGTDYENPLNRSCATYFIILYNYVHYAIEQPNINWVDLGASQRATKTSMGFKPQPCSAYFRCKNSFMQMVVEYSMEKYYDAEKCIADP